MIQLYNEQQSELDCIILDSPAEIEQGFKNAIAPSDLVDVVVNPEVSTVKEWLKFVLIHDRADITPGQFVKNE